MDKMIEAILDDGQVIKAICSGDRKTISRAFRYIYSDYFPLIKRLVLQKGGTLCDAADVFQESLTVFFNQINQGKFRGESSPKTYFYGIARNIWYKSFSLKSREIVGLPGMHQIGYHLDINPPAKRCLQKMIQELPGNCGEVLLDFYFRGLSMNEIRDKHRLGSTQAAKNKKLRSMKRLINQISRQGITVEAFQN